MNKISLKEVFKNAIEVYKEQHKVLLKLSGIHCLISYVIILSSVMIAVIPKENYALFLLASLVNLAISYVGLYFLVRMYASLMLASMNGYRGLSGSVGLFYRQAKPVTWRCIGYNLLLGLMHVIPVLLIAAAVLLHIQTFFEVPFFLIIILGLIGIASLLAIGTLFYFSITTAVVYKHPKSIFGYSVKLLKGNFGVVLVLFLLNGLQVLYSSGYSFLFDVMNRSFLVQASLYLLEMIPLLFAMPFLISLMVVAMQMIEGQERNVDAKKDVIY